MGAEESKAKQPQMSVSDVQHILDQQRQQFEKKLQEELAKQRAEQAKEQISKQRAEQSSMPSAATASTSGVSQQQAAPSAPQQLYPNLNQTPINTAINHYHTPINPVHVNQTHPFIQPNPMFQPHPLNQPHPFNQPHPLNQPHPFNKPHPFNQPRPRNPRNYHNSCQNRATSTPPPAPQNYVFDNAPGQRPAPSAPLEPSTPAAPWRGPRNRSNSRPRNNQERGIYDCITCNQRYGLKIFQCPNGHSVCNDCKVTGRPCGICGQPPSDVRNFEIENHIAQTTVPCPNQNEGCTQQIKLLTMENHLKNCTYREQQCPLSAIFGECRWKGKLSDLSSHFDEMHSSNRGFDVDKEFHLKDVHNSSQMVHLVVIGVNNFLCHMKVSEPDGKIFMAVQLLGNKMNAKKWSYEIHIYQKSKPRRKYMYTDTCLPASANIEDIFKAGSCATLPIFYAATFADTEGMAFKLFITNPYVNKNEESVNRNNNGNNFNQRGRGRNYYNHYNNY